MQLRQQVEALLARAEEADQQQDEPQALPEEIARREKLLKKMEEVCARLEERARERAAAERAACQRQGTVGQQRDCSAKGAKQTDAQPPQLTPKPDEQINLTDPQWRLMRKSKRQGSSQSYNCQAVVDAGGSQ